MKKTSKLIVLAAVGVMIAALGIFGCSSGSSSASASASASGSSASASATSASASASSAAAATEIKLLTDGKLVIGTSPDYPPFENLENGEFVGLDMEIAKAIGEKLGLEVEFKSLQFDAIIPAVAAGGQVDMGISGFTVDPDRAKETAENADEALAKATIAVQSGTSGEAYIQENFPEATVQPYGNSTDAFAAMQAGQADAVCTNAAVVQKMLADAYQDAQIVKSIATGEEYAIVISKDNPALTKAVNEALAELTADGTIDRLVQQYLS